MIFFLSVITTCAYYNTQSKAKIIHKLQTPVYLTSYGLLNVRFLLQPELLIILNAHLGHFPFQTKRLMNASQLTDACTVL